MSLNLYEYFGSQIEARKDVYQWNSTTAGRLSKIEIFCKDGQSFIKTYNAESLGDVQSILEQLKEFFEHRDYYS